MAKPKPDWEKIELEYRAGVRTLRAIAEDNKISHVAINNKAKREGWTRDLHAKIVAKTHELVTKHLVTKKVTKEGLVTEKEIVDATAEESASILLSHKASLLRGRNLALSLLGELETTTENVELFKQLGEILFSPDDKGIDKRNEIYCKVISMPGRVDSIKKLSDTLKNLIALEREAINIDKDRTGEGHNNLTDEQVTTRINQLLAKARSV